MLYCAFWLHQFLINAGNAIAIPADAEPDNSTDCPTEMKKNFWTETTKTMLLTSTTSASPVQTLTASGQRGQREEQLKSETRREDKLRPIIIMDGIDFPDSQLQEADNSSHPITTSDGIPLSGFDKNLNVTHSKVIEPKKESDASDLSPTCWKPHYYRGAGTIPNKCNGGKVRQGLLCRKPCKPGYKGVGFLCWEDCPTGYITNGITCKRAKPMRIISRKRYNRGEGTHMECPPEKENRSGLCYHKCRNGFEGIGSVCWAQCSGKHSRSCGAYCAVNLLICGNGILNMISSTSEIMANIIAIALTGGSVMAARIAVTGGRKMVMDAMNSAGVSMSKFFTPEHFKMQWRLLKYRVIEGLILTAAGGEPFDWGELDPTGIRAVMQAFRFPFCQI